MRSTVLTLFIIPLTALAAPTEPGTRSAGSTTAADFFKTRDLSKRDEICPFEKCLEECKNGVICLSIDICDPVTTCTLERRRMGLEVPMYWVLLKKLEWIGGFKFLFEFFETCPAVAGARLMMASADSGVGWRRESLMFSEGLLERMDSIAKSLKRWVLVQECQLGTQRLVSWGRTSLACLTNEVQVSQGLF
ncbi:hypothetical protein QBC34DRAFT_420126 [Podospora aff. communis PSN243]|uniref:Extracellular membrane protein CFEM domain-containing protein n=1 Tax=Podospora aff. communis PSN243 TaxID=3040156 RepID=A0AAV9H6F7_9PEZI|nr:hypothetical protein QBC34DRAFT_420126 [Podospora aff. communis PSN243]